jgi:tripartite-type tricarboxylate transporter receptor subunit TctC
MRRLVPAILFLSLTQIASFASAQGFPTKPLRIYTADAGSGNDQLTRLVAQAIAPPLGQPVVVENRGATLSAIATAKAPPDGHTLVFAASALWLSPFVEDVSYDPVKDFAPISMVSNQPVVLVIAPSLPVNSMKELIALAKAKPGVLNYGSSNTATVSHLAGELLKSMGSLDIVRIPFKGVIPSVTAVMAGDVEMAFPTLAGVVSLAKAGKIKLLAVSSLTRLAVAPDLPTISESGLPGFEVLSRAGMLTTGRTPAAVINRLNKEIVAAIRNPDIEKKILALGSEPTSGTPEEFKDRIEKDMSRMGALMKSPNWK